MQAEDKDIVVIAWNGRDEALAFIDFDAAPNFDLILFNYSGNKLVPKPGEGKKFDQCFSVQTEFKGELLFQLSNLIADCEYRYVGILDDDQQINVSGINQLLLEAAELQADLFQPSITHDSFYSHGAFLQKKGQAAEPVLWVEIMAPFLRKTVFEAGTPFYKENISSYGIDLFLFPYLLKKLGFSKTYLMHSVAIKHNKQVTDGVKRFSNGLDARQEGEVLRKKIVQKIKEEKIDFSNEELREIYGVGKIRWNVLKYNVKRKLSFMI
jgi:hypothetical protein